MIGLTRFLRFILNRKLIIIMSLLYKSRFMIFVIEFEQFQFNSYNGILSLNV